MARLLRVYLVPTGQVSTVFIFEATSGGGSGNLLDRISFDRPSTLTPIAMVFKIVLI